MNRTGSTKPLIHAGWLRALLYVIALGISSATALSVYIVSRPKNPSPTAILQNLNPSVTMLLIFTLTLLITFIFRRWIDRRPMLSLGLYLNGHGKEIMAGICLGIFILSASTGILRLTGHLKWMDILFDARNLFLALGMVLITAFYEEIIFRGYILNNLMDSFPKWLALLISSILFMIVHGNQAGFIPLANALVMGLILGLNYLYTRNLWFSYSLHVSWLFFEKPVLGMSGDDSVYSLLQPALNGDANITGGAAGLEGSFILLSVSLLVLVVLYFFLQKKINPKFRPAPGRI